MTINVYGFGFDFSILWSSWIGLVLLILFCFSVYWMWKEDCKEDTLSVCFTPMGIIIVIFSFFLKDSRLFNGISFIEKVFAFIFYLTFPAWLIAHLVRSIWFI